MSEALFMQLLQETKGPERALILKVWSDLQREITERQRLQAQYQADRSAVRYAAALCLAGMANWILNSAGLPHLF